MTTSTTTTISTTTSTSDLLALGLGSNAGSRRANLRRAIADLRHFLGELAVAPLYRTAPVSPIDQPDFLNTVVVGRARRHPEAPGPEAILAYGKALELAAGRRRGVRFGPRPLDVDLLFLGDSRRDYPELTLPHPRLTERRFVLAPLADLCPRLRLPPSGRTARQLLDRLGTEHAVERIGWTRPEAG